MPQPVRLLTAAQNLRPPSPPLQLTALHAFLGVGCSQQGPEQGLEELPRGTRKITESTKMGHPRKSSCQHFKIKLCMKIEVGVSLEALWACIPPWTQSRSRAEAILSVDCALSSWIIPDLSHLLPAWLWPLTRVSSYLGVPEKGPF